jgi:serine protease AprX
MRKSSKFLRLIIPIIVLLSLVGNSVQPARAEPLLDDANPPRAYPALLEMAKERPDEKMRVIVQMVDVKQKKGRPQDLAAQAVIRAGGKVTKKLRLIDGMAVELPAHAVAALAKNPNVRWISLDAPLRSTLISNSTVRDDFNSLSFANNNGTASWLSPWWENDPQAGGAGPTSGQVQVNSGALRLDDSPDTGGQPSAARSADLSGATNATLSFDFTTSYGVDTNDAVVVEVSMDGGAYYTPLEFFTDIYGFASGSRSYDISGFISSATTVRFRVVSFYGAGDEFFYVDNLQIEFFSDESIDTTNLVGNFIRDLGADQLWNGEPYLQGQGITVAVVDSGIAEHPDFQTNGVSRILTSINFSSISPDANDENGHGTHVAGIIAGDGSDAGGEYMGIAPKVNLLNVKVSNFQGMSYTSDLLNALEWIYNNKDVYNIRVVNLSLNSSVPEPYHVSPIDAAVEILWFNGIVVVVSAGNNGVGAEPVTLYPPANDPFVITVGAADDRGTLGISDDAVPNFSAYGTTEDGFTKPDIVAPGRYIISALSGMNALLNVEHPNHYVGPTYFRMSGTSMAAPMVAGAAALLLQDEPYLTPDQVKDRLMATANMNWDGYDPAKAGAGYLDIYAAVQGTTMDSANYGLLASELLWTGTDQITWGSVSWNSVSWNSVSWNSVSWNSVSWNSVSWNSVSWNSSFWDEWP